MKTSDFDYTLPAELIAQTPIEPRDRSRFIVLNRKNRSITHRHFSDIVDYLSEGDVLVFNDSRVIPARLKGRKVEGGGRVEILLLRRLNARVWEALAKPSKRLPIGSRVDITNDSLRANHVGTRTFVEVLEEREGGIKVLSLSDESLLSALGEIALPPYIHTPLARPERYQTVYSRVEGSVAAPTAGLHFTPELLGNIQRKGVQCFFVTLHVGLDTFRPVREDDPRQHPIHKEYAVLSETVAEQLSQAKQAGRRIICVGTTTARILEHVAQISNPLHLQPFEDSVDLFMLPGYEFRMVDALVTNFHLPRSTLLMLVIAFAGGDFVRQAYREAIAQRYRFYSFGDAMLII
ncbi:tRNA preQ1(34) S-adenosylmethionine ribosyltransferase-isomerase QueA [Chloroflexota bacterium]